MIIKFEIIGEPVAKARARTFYNERAKKTMSFTPAKSASFEQLVALTASQYRPRGGLLEKPLAVSIEIFRNIPKSFSKKKKEAAETKKLLPITKPDIDNFVKSIFDPLNGVIWVDDSQVVSLNVNKYYSVTPRVEVIISEIEQ